MYVCSECGHSFTRKVNLEYHQKHRVCQVQVQTKPKLRLKTIFPLPLHVCDNYAFYLQWIPQILHEAITNHTTNFIVYLIEQTNGNPNRPMFNNIKLSNKREQIGLVFDGKQYSYMPRKKIISQLIENKRVIMNTYVEKHEDTIDIRSINKYQKYVNCLDEEPSMYKELELEVLCILLNVREHMVTTIT
jgi:hypothetical protein